MLLLVNNYGLSHVCALQEFKNIENELRFTLPYNFPYLDIYLSTPSFNSSNTNIEFYYRGAKDQNLKFRNLFEYLFWTALNGYGYILC